MISEVVEVLSGRDGLITAQIRDQINWNRHKHYTTPQVLRELKKLEQQKYVERVKTSYKVQICWALTHTKHE